MTDELMKALLDQHADNERHQFLEIKQELRDIKDQVTDLLIFKTSVIAESKFSAKWTAILVSSVAGVIGFLANMIGSWLIAKQAR